MNGNVRPVPSTITGYASYYVMGVEVTACDRNNVSGVQAKLGRAMPSGHWTHMGNDRT